EVRVVHVRVGSILRELVPRQNRQIGEPDAVELAAPAKEVELPTGFIDLHRELRVPWAREGCGGGVLEVVACKEAHHIRVLSILKIVCVSQVDIALRIRLNGRWGCAVSALVYRREGCASVHAP